MPLSLIDGSLKRWWSNAINGLAYIHGTLIDFQIKWSKPYPRIGSSHGSPLLGEELLGHLSHLDRSKNLVITASSPIPLIPSMRGIE